MDTSLEHFVHIEDVVRFIKTHLPAEHGAEQWQNICTDVLHCELGKVEPILLKELAQSPDLAQADQIRELLRAASWYTHPQATTEELLRKLVALQEILPENILTAEMTLQIRLALEQKQSGSEVLSAARAIERVIQNTTGQSEYASSLSSVHALRDQIYYQLLYPHWFEVVKTWTQTQKT